VAVNRDSSGIGGTVGDDQVIAWKQYERLRAALASPQNDSEGIAAELMAVGDETGLPASQLADLELAAFRVLIAASAATGYVPPADMARLSRVADVLGVDHATLASAVAPHSEIPTARPPIPAAFTPVTPARSPQVSVQVNVSTPSNNVIVLHQGDASPGFLIRALWFVFIGWWLSFWWITIAWLLNLTIIGLPLGLIMINRVPVVITLQSQKKRIVVTQQGGATLIQSRDIDQLPMWLRAIYFVLIGWWASLAFGLVAWLLSVLILTLPLGLIMFNFLPQVTTLRRN